MKHACSPIARVWRRREGGVNSRLFTTPAVDSPYPNPLGQLDAIAMRTLRLDLAASVFAGATEAVLQMGPALAKKGFDATGMQVALLTCGQSLGLILSFFVAHLAAHSRKMPLVFWPEALRCLVLVAVFFLDPSFVVWFVVLHAAAQMFHNMPLPARVTIYRLNYPSELRGGIVGRNRRVVFLVAAIVSIVMSGVLDGWIDLGSLYGALGVTRETTGRLVPSVVAAVGLLGIVGTGLFALAPVREPPRALEAPRQSYAGTLRAFVRVWLEDKEFRRYENFFFIFGFANIMTIPLTQLHAVDVLHASYFDLAMINVAVMQVLMALTMGWWGKLVDRYSPSRLRGFINVIFSIDFLALAIAPTVEWLYVGRAFRGIALGGGTLIWMLGALYYARTPEKVPIYLGVHTVLTGVRWAVAPVVGVWAQSWFGGSSRPVFFIVFVVVLFTALLMIRSSRHEEPRTTPEGPPMPAPRMTGA